MKVLFFFFRSNDCAINCLFQTLTKKKIQTTLKKQTKISLKLQIKLFSALVILKEIFLVNVHSAFQFIAVNPIHVLLGIVSFHTVSSQDFQSI